MHGWRSRHIFELQRDVCMCLKIPDRQGKFETSLFLFDLSSKQIDRITTPRSVGGGNWDRL